MSLYLGLVLTSSDTIIPNSSQHLHQSLRASGAPNAFFRTDGTTPSKGLHIHHSSSADVVLGTLHVPIVTTTIYP